MTDEAKALVERLREVGRDGVWKSGRNPTTAHPMCIKAADLIETQAREIERLREALAMSIAEMMRASGRLQTIAGCNEDRRIAAALSATCDFSRAALAGDTQ